MRTTLTIDDDVLSAARARAEAERRPVGEIISDLARQGLRRGATAIRPDDYPTLPLRPLSAPRIRNGIPLLPGRTDYPTVTLEMVNELRDALD